jgi:hypothetical protein
MPLILYIHRVSQIVPYVSIALGISSGGRTARLGDLSKKKHVLNMRGDNRGVNNNQTWYYSSDIV